MISGEVFSHLGQEDRLNQKAFIELPCTWAGENCTPSNSPQASMLGCLSTKTEGRKAGTEFASCGAGED